MNNAVIPGSERAHTLHVQEFLKAIGATEFLHTHCRSLYDHLVGTQAILRAWRQPEWICDGGALHSIYGTVNYRRHLLAFSRRPHVQAIVGKQAERLAYLFGIVVRRALFASLESDRWSLTEGLDIECDADGVQGSEPLSRDEASALVILHMANIAEQVCGADGSPAFYLANLSRWGRLIRSTASVIPPVFETCHQTVSAEDEAAAVEAYRAGLAVMAGDYTTAIAQMSEAISRCPWVGEPAIWLAYLALQQGALSEAVSWIARGRELCRQWGTAWDKRLAYHDWQFLIDFVASQAIEPDLGPLPAPDPHDLPRFVNQLQRRNLVELFLGFSSEPEPSDTGVARFHRYLAAFPDPDRDPCMKVYPGLRACAWHDPQDFPLVRALEDEADVIRQEILALNPQQFAPEGEPIRRIGDWSVLFFFERGRRNEVLCGCCPVTSRVIESHRSVRTLAGLSYVSRLSPGTHVTPHVGPTNLRVRCHLGIQVPIGNCGIRVDSQTRQWQQGKCLVFDDFLRHEAWNHTSEDRVVLIVDLWHPDLTDEEITSLEGLHRYTAAQAASLHQYWSANDKARTGMDDRSTGLC